MFKRQNRLPRGVRFYNSSFLSAPLFVLKVKKNGLMRNRFGISVSRKIDKRAVIRNKIKRIFRETLIVLDKNLTIGNDMLFIIKKEIVGKTKEQINLLIVKELEKLSIK